MAAGQLAELIRMISVGALQGVQTKFEYGELSEFDPKTYTGKFILPMVLGPDPNGGAGANNTPQETGFIPIGSLFTGPGYGLQFIPDSNAQAVVLFMDHQGFSPVAAIFMFNTVEVPPFPDGKTNGWMDKIKNQIKTTVDGLKSGDKKGGARIVGTGYASVVAPRVDLGAENLPATDNVVRQKELQAVVNDINARIDQFNSHTHGGVQGGPSTTSPPTSSESHINQAKASATVFAND
jgi:hypothetical protein